MKFVSFPDIKLFNSVIKTVRHHTDYKGKNEADEAIYLHDVPYPTIEYKGTVIVNQEKILSLLKKIMQDSLLLFMRFQMKFLMLSVDVM